MSENQFVAPLQEDYTLTPGDVALRLGVNPKTVTRWAQSGKISCLVLPSGHRRYSEKDIAAMKKTKVDEGATRKTPW